MSDFEVKCPTCGKAFATVTDLNIHTDTEAEFGSPGGFEDMVEAVREIWDAPPTDDPVDTLRAIAKAVSPGYPDYDYFDDKGQWVLYPVKD